MYGVDGDNLSRQYKRHISGFGEWEWRDVAEAYVLFEKNLGPRLSIDETCLSQDEVYTVVTNKDAHGRKGSLVAMVKGTRADDVATVLRKMSAGLRSRVREITLDLSPSMKQIAKRSFPCAIQVSDRFHVQQLMGEAVEDLRIKHRWEAIDQENAEIQMTREAGRAFRSHVLANGETRRQLLARSKRLLVIHPAKWTDSQKARADVLFRHYPDLKTAYDRYLELVDIYNTRDKPRPVLMTRLARWYERVRRMHMKSFNTVLETFTNNYVSILNYFDNRSTNASAESFNAKVKAFRLQFRGVTDIPFFIFRLASLFA